MKQSYIAAEIILIAMEEGDLVRTSGEGASDIELPEVSIKKD